MKKALFAVLAVSVASCAPRIITVPFTLIPTNQTAISDGPVNATITASSASQTANVNFDLASGEILSGTMTYTQDTSTTTNIFGQAVGQTTSNQSHTTILASDGKKTMNCDGTIANSATDLQCHLTDGAEYRFVH